MHLLQEFQVYLRHVQATGMLRPDQPPRRTHLFEIEIVSGQRNGVTPQMASAIERGIGNLKDVKLIVFWINVIQNDENQRVSDQVYVLPLISTLRRNYCPRILSTQRALALPTFRLYLTFRSRFPTSTDLTAGLRKN